MHWSMAWDLTWFRLFAKCSDEWHDWIIAMTGPVYDLYPDNDNRRQS